MARLAISLCFLLVGQAVARHGAAEFHQNLKRQSGYQDLTGRYPTQNFTMPLDHFHNESRYEPHTNRTFENHYWLDTSNYVEGGPVIVNALGEDNYQYDLEWLQKGLLQELTSATGGVAVLWGQRYYSGNYIIENYEYTTENLRFHTTEQALADLAYFATHVKFPGLEHKNLTALGTPWIIMGGSYAGAISAFTRIQYPDIFWGGITSSGITTAITDFWQFYDVVRRYGPTACIEAQQKFINIADNILTSGNKSQIRQFKTAFGFQTLTANSAFANLLTSPMGNWQGHNWVPGESYPFTGPGTFCANMTSQKLLFPSTAKLAGTAREIITNGGWGNETSSLLNPLLNWIGNIKSQYGSLCPPSSTLNECWDNHDPAPFDYMTCTEYGLFATGYIAGSPGHPAALPVASRLLSLEMFLQNCRSTYNITSPPNLQSFNKYGGFNLSYPRLTISAGEVDIWRPAEPLAEQVSFGVPNPRAGKNGPVSAPQILIANGGHEWDLSGVFPNQTTATLPPNAAKSAHKRELEAVKLWLDDWKKERGGSN